MKSVFLSLFFTCFALGAQAQSANVQKALKSNDATVNFSKLHKVNYVSAVATMRYSGWTLLITAPASEFIAENISNFISTFGFISLIMGIIGDRAGLQKSFFCVPVLLSLLALTVVIERGKKRTK